MFGEPGGQLGADVFGLSKRPEYTSVTQTRTPFRGREVVGVSLVAKEPLAIGQARQVFTSEEAELLTSGRIGEIEKFFSVQGLKGNLRMRLLGTEATFPGPEDDPNVFDWHHFFSPKTGQLLAPETAEENPFYMGACFNETAKVTPVFALIFPTGVQKEAEVRVMDWDVIGERYDATQGIYLPNNPSRDVNIVFPSDPAFISEMQVQVGSRTISYPSIS